ncbi:unnamed protein product [Prorocentrum cordatum]|uniref:Uncharacterized protein n=1 Tax=Prorocentrum cordatum TaxID=2364126 RepID=A0ABN9SSP9_9DINO|nr:unnamed protein product [Polarella glacialis]
MTVPVLANTSVDLQPVLDAISSRATVADLQKVVQDISFQPVVDLQPVLDAVASRATVADVQREVQDIQLQPEVDLGPIQPSPGRSGTLGLLLDAIASRPQLRRAEDWAQDFKAPASRGPYARFVKRSRVGRQLQMCSRRCGTSAPSPLWTSLLCWMRSTAGRRWRTCSGPCKTSSSSWEWT